MEKEITVRAGDLAAASSSALGGVRRGSLRSKALNHQRDGIIVGLLAKRSASLIPTWAELSGHVLQLNQNLLQLFHHHPDVAADALPAIRTVSQDQGS